MCRSQETGAARQDLRKMGSYAALGASWTMLCSACNTENAEGARFCSTCGTSLAIRCIHCGAVNDYVNRFCPQCGLPLISELHRDPVNPAMPPAHLVKKILASRTQVEGERKYVTVMFADISGSLEIIRDWDPEQTQEVCDTAVEMM